VEALVVADHRWSEYAMSAKCPVSLSVVRDVFGLIVFMFLLFGAGRGQTESARPAPKLESRASPHIEDLQTAKDATVAEIVQRYHKRSEALASRFRADENGYPGSLFGFLRDSNRIEQERRRELARVLTPEDLEDIEFEVGSIGRVVRLIFGASAVATVQQRTVYRILRDMYDRCPAPKDDSFEALLEYRKNALETYKRIWREAGPVVAAEWLRRTEKSEYPPVEKVVESQGLPASAGLELWRARHQFKIRQIELQIHLAGQPDTQRASFEALIREFELRIIGVVGKEAFDTNRERAFRWLQAAPGSG
jgi:hypothetical protein